MSAEARMAHRVTVERSAPVLDSHGAPVLDAYSQPTAAFSAHATGVLASITAKSAREVASISQAGAVVSTVTIDVPVGTDITPADRVRHAAASCPVPAPIELPDRVYQLQGVRDASAAGLFLRCDATEVA